VCCDGVLVCGECIWSVCCCVGEMRDYCGGFVLGDGYFCFDYVVLL